MLKFRQIAIPDRQTLERLLLQNLDALGEGIEPVLSSVLPPGGTVPFILGRDGGGRSVVIEYDIAPDSTVLFNALQHLDWFSRHLALLSRMVPAGLLAPSLPPRLVLVLPHVPPEMERILARLTIQPDCFIFAHLSADHQSGLWLKPYPLQAASVRTPTFRKPDGVELSEEENAFFNRPS